MATKKVQSTKQVVVVAKPQGSNWARVVQGTLVEYDRRTAHAVLDGARQALFYGREAQGELGLAVNGPKGDSRVGPRVPGRVEVPGVVLVAECTPEALKVWEGAK